MLAIKNQRSWRPQHEHQITGQPMKLVGQDGILSASPNCIILNEFSGLDTQKIIHSTGEPACSHQSNCDNSLWLHCNQGKRLAVEVVRVYSSAFLFCERSHTHFVQNICTPCMYCLRALSFKIIILEMADGSSLPTVMKK